MERKKGTVGNDTLTGTNLSDALYGLAGNDRLSGLLGADILYGDAGNDTLIGGGGADTLYGGVGNDLYVVDSAGDLIWEPTASTSPVLASVTASGAQGDSESNTPAISSDGRFIAFVSFADNLVGDDTNARADVFRKDLVTGAITRVSTGSGGEEADSGGRGPSISGDGRLVAFYSNSATLVAGDANGASDVFVKDVATGALTRVSTGSGGAEANGASGNPVISEDGRYVAFKSGATNLVGIDTNGALDVFVKDRVSGTTTIASTSSAGVQANAGSELCDITPGGRYVLLYSPASNLVAGDTNGWADVFVKDCVTKAITRVSTSGTGKQGNNSSFGGAITPDGRYVLFESFASNLVAGDTNGVSDVFLKDRVTGATTRVSTSALGAQGNASSAIGCGISDDGRYVIFASEASNLAPGDTNGKLDAFVKDTVSGAVARVSVSAAGLQGDRESSPVTISGDGRWISIDSMATNLVAGDANDSNDVFRVNNPLLAGGGVDTVQSSVSYTLPAGIENLALLGAAALNGAGNGLANRLTGNGAANLLDGGAGSDVMIGGAGNDTYVVGAAGDVVTELAGGGTDTVRSGTSYTLPLNVERLVLTGSAALNGTGNSGNNVLTGNAAANLLNGAAGNDTLIGGAGNDTYVVNGGDTVAEGLNAGTDTVQSGVNTPALATNVENLVLTGTALTGTGNGLNNILTGNGLANVLTGLGGNDTLNGGLGNDRMIGGNGNDTYVVNAIGDIVTELAGAGTDTVRTALAWTLGANLENLTLTGLTHVAGTGNTLANVLTGNNGDNALVGMAGNDTLNGGPGVDTLTGGGGSDVFAFTTEPGATNFEVIVDFEVGVDKIVLENAVFTALATPGALSPDNFSANPATADATDHVIYDPADGRLYYDADGAGVGLDDMQIARLSTSLYTLSAADFLIT